MEWYTRVAINFNIVVYKIITVPRSLISINSRVALLYIFIEMVTFCKTNLKVLPKGSEQFAQITPDFVISKVILIGCELQIEKAADLILRGC